MLIVSVMVAERLEQLVQHLLGEGIVLAQNCVFEGGSGKVISGRGLITATWG